MSKRKNGANLTRFNLNDGIASLTLHQSPGGRNIVSVAGVSAAFAEAYSDPKERLRILKEMIIDGCSFFDQVIENMPDAELPTRVVLSAVCKFCGKRFKTPDGRMHHEMEYHKELKLGKR